MHIYDVLGIRFWSIYIVSTVSIPEPIHLLRTEVVLGKYVLVTSSRSAIGQLESGRTS